MHLADRLNQIGNLGAISAKFANLAQRDPAEVKRRSGRDPGEIRARCGRDLHLGEVGELGLVELAHHKDVMLPAGAAAQGLERAEHGLPLRRREGADQYADDSRLARHLHKVVPPHHPLARLQAQLGQAAAAAAAAGRRGVGRRGRGVPIGKEGTRRHRSTSPSFEAHQPLGVAALFGDLISEI